MACAGSIFCRSLDDRNIVPSRVYADIFPGLPEELVSRLVYSFDYQHDGVDEPALRKARRELSLLISRWKRVHRRDLRARDGNRYRRAARALA